MDHGDDIVLLLRRKLDILWNAVPFCQAATTARGSGVLSNKHRMPTHWRLLTVIRGMGRGKSLSNKIRRMAIDGLSPFFPTVLPLFRPQSKARPKRRTRQARKSRIQVRHQ